MRKISIITVCYNIKDEIERTCESIISQTANNYEWIVVDGGSTDDTVDILNKYKDKMSVFISEKDTGIYNSMNKGIQKATGEWCIFMNGGDCFASKEIIEKFSQLDGIYKYADIIYGNVCIINKNKKTYIKKYPYSLTKSYFFKDNINHQSTFIKTELFEKYGLYNENYQIAADWEKWLVFILNNAKFTYWNTPISDFYSGGASTTQSKKLQSEIQSIQKKYFFDGEVKLSDNTKQYIFLFKKIPLFFIKKKKFPYKINIKLFNFIPIYSIKQKEKTYIHYLFSFIPLFTIKDK
ncbi:MAG: glycosyltransferase [Alphaproteobacteria bacterium]|nr:glycosyltransferase [Alphaproteobacteria bacterium]